MIRLLPWLLLLSVAESAAADPPHTDLAGNHWSFQSPTATPLPAVRNTQWPRQPVDTWILARLETDQLQPAARAEKATLLRRTTYGLTGLPPTPHELQTFLASAAPDAFEREVDRLLASHHYGEQWARHWLDVVRYADSLGGTANFPFANAYRYRDYVIAAFNKDKPFARFVQELVAGDLLPAGDAEVEADRLTGPGALLLGPDILKSPLDAAADQIGMLTRALLGIDISCARCHDHPFEPLTTDDFYALAGIFTSTESKRFERQLVLPSGETVQVLSVKEGTVKNLRMRQGNDPGDAGTEIPRRFPRILAGDRQVPVSETQSGRWELAHWLTRTDHPLTSRVIANRLWQRHFSIGLVADPDNFGTSAVSGPSHQHLLDWLALHLVERDWSLKSLHRAILLSASYQQTSQALRSETRHGNTGHVSDPANRLLWRQNRRRLEAEEIRDTLLAISGQLNSTMGGSLFATLGLGNSAELKKNGRLQQVVNHYQNILQRSIYRPVVRTEMHMAELLDLFDFPGRDQMTGQRQTSTNAPQALLLMNSPFVLRQAHHTAAASLLDQEVAESVRVQRLYLRTLGRGAETAEVTTALRFITAWETSLLEETDPTVRRIQAWESFCQALFMLNEFIYLD